MADKKTPMKIAILSSVPATAKNVEQILKKFEYSDVQTFDNGIEALKILREQPFGFLICDMSVKYISGWTLVKEVKASDKIPNLPCMLLGDVAAPASDEELKQYGIVKYLKAPYRESDLTFLINSTLQLANTSGTIENKYTQAKAALIANKAKESVERFEELHGLTKKSMRSSLGLAEAYMQNSQIDKANAVIMEAVKSSTEVNPTSMMMQTNILLKQKTADQAYVITSKLVDEVMPTTPFYLSKSLKLYMDFSEYLFAEKICQRGIERKFKLPEFLLTQARCKYEQNTFQEAIEAIKTAEIEFGKSADLLNLRGVCLKKIGDFNGAIVSYEEALKLSPMDAKVYFNMASCAISAKSYEQAARYLESCLQINPDFPKVKEKLAEIKSKVVKKDAA